MSVIKIDFEQASALLNEVVEEAGADFVYSGGCRYESLSEPDCIVGRVLHKAGVDVQVLSRMDDPFSWPVEEGEEEYSSSEIHYVVESGVFEEHFTLDDDALRLLSKAQWEQDGRAPWGEAAEAAFREVRAHSAEGEDAT